MVYLSRDVILLVFFPRPQSPSEQAMYMLDISRALLFYLDRASKFRKDNNFFVCLKSPNRGKAVSPQTLSRWVTTAIKMYNRASLECLFPMKAHSTGAQASSAAFQCNLDIRKICGTATWSPPLTFIKHYSIDKDSRRETAAGKAVLQSMFH